jgi:hypothetical protein
MKKVLLLLFALICFGSTAMAQVCKISGSNDNVEVFTCYTDVAKNQVVVRVSNDSNEISANVTVTVEVRNVKQGSSRKKLTLTGKGLAKPNGPTEIRIDIPSGYELLNESTVQCTNISGTKCL